MTELSSSTGSYSEEYEVRVKAIVMCRDDSAGGLWSPLGTGSPSLVVLRKVPIIGVTGAEVCYNYIIHGHKEQSEVLRCILTKDVSYERATPTFHHWRVEGKRYGLVFQTNTDAKKFDDSISGAVSVLNVAPEVPHHIRLASAEETIFEQPNLQMTRKGSLSPSESTISTTTSSPPHHSPSRPALTDVVPLPSHSQRTFNTSAHSSFHSRRRPQKSSSIADEYLGMKDSVANERSELIELTTRCSPFVQRETKPWDFGLEPDTGSGGDFSYVHFNKGTETVKQCPQSEPLKHDYSYPSLESTSYTSGSKPLTSPRSSSLPPLSTSSSIEPLKVYNFRDAGPPLPSKAQKREKKKQKQLASGQKRERCLYCSETYTPSENERGSCEDAPLDLPARCVDRISCLCCARAILYHCVADSESQDYANPCVCDSSDENNTKKWTFLTLMSVFIPCLWCYWPLYGCYRCGVRCHCCGGRHKPMV